MWAGISNVFFFFIIFWVFNFLFLNHGQSKLQMSNPQIRQADCVCVHIYIYIIPIRITATSCGTYDPSSLAFAPGEENA